IMDPLLKAKRLHLVAKAPEFSMPAYVVYPLDREGDHFANAVELMHRVADAKTADKGPAQRTRKRR
ncbi:MAG: LysR family transcriptional regulator, partial [Ramlibacter sp.]|nr:LysR family transcriptional regulator [Ramlibacter sp.]